MTLPGEKLESELQLLRRLAHKRRMLELPANLYAEKAPRECQGRCKSPVAIGNLGLTCCHLRVQYDEYHDILRVETMQRQRVAQARTNLAREQSRQIEGSPLQERYYRDFTGTGVHRRLKEGKEEG